VISREDIAVVLVASQLGGASAVDIPGRRRRPSRAGPGDQRFARRAVLFPARDAIAMPKSHQPEEDTWI